MTLADLIEVGARAGTDASVQAVWNAFLPTMVAEGVRPELSGEGNASALADIYTTRMGYLQDTGWETGGFAETIQALRRETGRVTGVRITTSRYHGLCFLTPDLQKMIGFLYVRRDENRQEEGAGGTPLGLA
jgi:hypothetical protein